DGDAVHAVIRGSGVNGDGRTNGITAPSATSQAALMRRVHARAGIGPGDIGYVEAHGTGTALGDPIEVKGLREVLAGAPEGARCGLGSVKATIGHCTTAAGIAALIKTVLALRHRTLPPLVNFTAPNPRLDLGDGPLYVVREPEPWRPGPSGVRTAAVSSFGFSGTNCHLVVTQPPEPARGGPAAGNAVRPLVVPVSARDEAALARTALALADAVETGSPALADVAHTLTARRPHHAVRAALIASGPGELVALLRALAHGDDRAGLIRAGTPARDGEGAPERAARAYVAGGTTEGWPATGGRPVPLPTYPFARERYWAEPLAPSAGRQPGTEIVREVAPDRGPVADHRVGGRVLLPGAATLALAWDAAAALGVTAPFRLTGVRWLRPCPVPGAGRVRTRAAAGPSGTWTLTLTGTDAGDTDNGDGEHARAVLAPLPPGTAVPPVDPAAVARRCPPGPAGPELYERFARAGIAYGPRLRRVTGTRVGDGEVLAELGGPPAGPGAPWEARTAVLDAALQAIAAPHDGTDAPALPFAVDTVTVLGPWEDAELSHVRREGSGWSVRLTDRTGRVLLSADGVSLRPAPAPAGPRAVEAKEPDGAELTTLVPHWVPLSGPDAAPGAGRRTVAVWFPETDGRDLADALLAEHAGDETSAIGYGPEGCGTGGLPAPPDVAYFLTAPGGDDPDAAPLALFRLIRSLLALDAGHRPLTLKVVTAGAVTTRAGERVDPFAAGVHGGAAVAGAEFPRWTGGCVDLDPAPGGDPAGRAARLAREPAAEPLVALRGTDRLRRALRPAPGAAPAPPGRPGGTYVILGGAGGIGLTLARDLARRGGARLALIGRRPLDARIAAALDEIAALGGEAQYLRADAADPEALRAAVVAARERFGPVRGAVHAALVLRDRTLAHADEATFLAALAPKTAGTLAFAEALSGEQPDFLVMFSSAASFTAPAGQANYAAAGTFQDACALYLRERLPFPVSVVNWGYWGSVGVVADERYRRRLAGFGVGSIDPGEGLAALDRVLAADHPQAVVVKAGPDGLARLGAAPRPPAERAAFAGLDTVAGDLLRARLAAVPGLPVGETWLDDAEVADRPGAATPAARRLAGALSGVLERAGAAERRGGRFRLTPDLTAPARLPVAELLERHPELAPHVELLRVCVAALPEVVAGRRPATEVLFPRGSSALGEAVYAGQEGTDHHHRLVADAVAGAARRVRDERGGTARVVEVGAGTGAGTRFVLDACARAGVPVSYVYTDLSVAFLRHGEDLLSRRQDGAEVPSLAPEFRILDIERDPLEQGFAAGEADVLVATNVLHATADIARTLRNAARLLRPGGLLLLNEATAATDFLTLTFGLTDGWWRYEDAGRRLPGSPLLAPGGWRAVLADAGFRVTDQRGLPGVPTDELEQCLTTAVLEGEPMTQASPTPGRPSPRAEQVRAYLRGVFAEVLRYGPDHLRELDDEATFDSFGVDSLVSQHIVHRLEQDLGDLPATLLFEQLTIARLADHLAGLLGEPRHAAVGHVLSPKPI
uniref:SDR family NAD(P)-dependent oxidoreductase n=1 Tax=Streptomyces specialis TaxID=498367 RepID=UPI000A6AD972